LTRLFSKEKRISSSPDRDVVIFGRPLNYFISYYDHSAAKWRIWFDWKERAQDRECLRSKHKGNEYKHCCEFPARRFYENQSPFIILLRDLPAQVLKSGIECYDCTVTADEYEKPPPEEKEQDANSRMEMSSTPAQDVYEIRPRNDRDGFDLISDRLRRGPIWYAGPDAVRNAVSFAKYTSRSRSRWAIIRVFDEAGNVTEAHER
jgi:hypothetical protein